MIEALTIFAQAHGLNLWECRTCSDDCYKIRFVDIENHICDYIIDKEDIATAKDEDNCIQAIISHVSNELVLLSVLN